MKIFVQVIYISYVNIFSITIMVKYIPSCLVLTFKQYHLHARYLLILNSAASMMIWIKAGLFCCSLRASYIIFKRRDFYVDGRSFVYYEHSLHKKYIMLKFYQKNCIRKIQQRPKKKKCTLFLSKRYKCCLFRNLARKNLMDNIIVKNKNTTRITHITIISLEIYIYLSTFQMLHQTVHLLNIFIT